MHLSDASINAYKGGLVAIYTLSFWLSFSIDIPAFLELNGANTQASAVILDNRNNIGIVIMTYNNIKYTIKAGELFKINIASNQDTINFTCRKWDTSTLYVLGHDLNTLYQTF